MCRIKALVSSALSFFTSLSLWWCWVKAAAKIFYQDRTESHVPHRSLPIALCLVSFSHKRSSLLLFSAIPSRCFLPFFHPSCLLFYPPPLLSVSLPLGEPHTASSPEPICSSPASTLSFFFFFLWLVFSSISPSSPPVDSCLSRGNLSFFLPSPRSAVPT